MFKTIEGPVRDIAVKYDCQTRGADSSRRYVPFRDMLSDSSSLSDQRIDYLASASMVYILGLVKRCMAVGVTNRSSQPTTNRDLSRHQLRVRQLTHSINSREVLKLKSLSFISL